MDNKHYRYHKNDSAELKDMIEHISFHGSMWFVSCVTALLAFIVVLGSCAAIFKIVLWLTGG